jgi:hypothetical protein
MREHHRQPAGRAAAKEIEGGVVAQPPRPAAEVAVRLLAYRKWEAAGRPGGDGVPFWLEAERELADGGDPAARTSR